VKSDGKLSGKISVNRGVRLAGPTVFNLAMNEIIKNIKDKKGYRMSNEEISIICYADDAVLIADREDNLQRLLHQFMLNCQKHNMKISTSKTKTLTLSKEPLRRKFEVQGKNN
jgi:hypothetical protein